MSLASNDNSGSDPQGSYVDAFDNNVPADTAQNALGEQVFTFHLGQFNVDGQMTVEPTFETVTADVVGDYHYTVKMNWYAQPNTGWHKLFRFQVDGDDITDSNSDDITIVTDPYAWMEGKNSYRDRSIRFAHDATDLNGHPATVDGDDVWLDSSYSRPSDIAGKSVPGETWTEDNGSVINLLETTGELMIGGAHLNVFNSVNSGPHSVKMLYRDVTGAEVSNNTTMDLHAAAYGGVTRSSDLNPTFLTNNKNATNFEDSVSKDFLRHMANEVMGGYAAGAKRGLVDIFNNEAALFNAIQDRTKAIENIVRDGEDDISLGSVITQLEASHHTILTDAAGATTFASLPNRIENNNYAAFDASCNVAQLYDKMLDPSTHAQYVDISSVKYNTVSDASNIGLKIVKQFLTYIQTADPADQAKMLKRLDNLFTPNETVMDWSGNYHNHYRPTALAAMHATNNQIPFNSGVGGADATDGSINKVIFADVGVDSGVIDLSDGNAVSGLGATLADGFVYDKLTVSHNLYDYRRRRNKYDFMEVLQRGDTICFTVTINPLVSTPLGNNPIAPRIYKYEITLQDAENVDYTKINNLGINHSNIYATTA